MKILIIPEKKSVAEDFNKIYMALRANGEIDLANFVCEKATWAEVDEANPYVEIHLPSLTESL